LVFFNTLLEKATAELLGIGKTLRDYVVSPETWGSELKPLAISARRLYEESLRLGVPAIATLTIAASLRTAFFFEIAKKFGRASDWPICRETAREFKTHLVKLRQDLIVLTASRFSAVQNMLPVVPESALLDHHMGPSNRPIIRFPNRWYYKDGQLVGPFSPFNSDAEDARRRDIEQTTQRALAEIMVPAEAIADELVARTPETSPFDHRRVE
jgi:hypothetical protein